MIGAFVYITAHSFANRILFRLRRLRQPRYLISAIAAGAYFWFFLFRNTRTRGTMPEEMATLFTDIGAVAVLAGMVLAWMVSNASALEFSEAEIHFLFSGPVTRLQTLLYKLLRAQPAVLVTALIFTFLRLPNGKIVGVWVTFTVISIYLTFVELVRARLRRAGVPELVFYIVPLLVVAAVGWVLFANADLGQGEDDDIRPFEAPISRAILFVPGIVVGALASKSPLLIAAYCAALLAAGAVMLLAGARLDVPFEELVIDSSGKRAAWRERFLKRHAGESVTARHIRPLFELRDGMAPEMALVWKNLIATTRIAMPMMAFLGVVFGAIFVTGMIVREPVVTGTMFGMSLFLAASFPFVASGVFKQDLRLDFRNYDILKTYPLSGERLVGASMLAPLVVMSVFEIAFLVGTSLLSQRVAADGPPRLVAMPQFVITALLFAVPVCATQLTIRNGMAILLPGWAGRSKEEQRGFVAIGQRIVSMIINLVILAVLLFPPAVVVAGGYWAASRVASGPVPLAMATMPAVALLAGELFLLVRLLGSQFEQLDVGTDIDPGTSAL